MNNGADDERRHRDRAAQAAALEARGDGVREREAPEVAQRFGDEQHDEQERGRQPDAEQEAGHAGERDGARDPQERGGGDLVAGEREAVLPAGQPPARDVVVARVALRRFA
jgi:hypothetical protein